MTPYGSFHAIEPFTSAPGTGRVPWTDGILPATSFVRTQRLATFLTFGLNVQRSFHTDRD